MAVLKSSKNNKGKRVWSKKMCKSNEKNNSHLQELNLIANRHASQTNLTWRSTLNRVNKHVTKSNTKWLYYPFLSCLGLGSSGNKL